MNKYQKKVCKKAKEFINVGAWHERKALARMDLKTTCKSDEKELIG